MPDLPKKSLSERKAVPFTVESRLSHDITSNSSDNSTVDGEEEKFFDAEEYTEAEKEKMAEKEKFFDAREYTDAEIAEQLAKTKQKASSTNTSSPATLEKEPAVNKPAQKSTKQQKKPDSRPPIGFGSHIPRERTGKGMTRDEMIQDFNGHIRDYVQPKTGQLKNKPQSSATVSSSSSLIKKPTGKQKEKYVSFAEGEKIWKDGLRQHPLTKSKRYKALSPEQKIYLNELSKPKKTDEIINSPHLSHSEAEKKWRKSLREPRSTQK